jgi:hypothetical protein
LQILRNGLLKFHIDEDYLKQNRQEAFDHQLSNEHNVLVFDKLPEGITVDVSLKRELLLWNFRLGLLKSWLLALSEHTILSKLCDLNSLFLLLCFLLHSSHILLYLDDSLLIINRLQFFSVCVLMDLLDKEQDVSLFVAGGDFPRVPDVGDAADHQDDVDKGPLADYARALWCSHEYW